MIEHKFRWRTLNMTELSNPPKKLNAIHKQHTQAKHYTSIIFIEPPRKYAFQDKLPVLKDVTYVVPNKNIYR